jgi:hypothetical protein
MIHGDACFAYFNKIWGIPRVRAQTALDNSGTGASLLGGVTPIIPTILTGMIDPYDCWVPSLRARKRRSQAIGQCDRAIAIRPSRTVRRIKERGGEAEHWRHSSLMSLSLIFESDRGV